MAGPVPPSVEEWLADRRAGPLAAGVVARYERISRGKGADTNGAITVEQSGKVTGSGPIYGRRLRPRRLQLEAAELAALRESLATLDGAAPYQQDHPSKGGDWEVVTRAEGTPPAVIFENARRPVLEELRNLARRLEGGE